MRLWGPVSGRERERERERDRERDRDRVIVTSVAWRDLYVH